MPRQESKMLLDLPPEILELVLLNTDPSTFSLMLMTCKSIRANVLASSTLLYEHLLRVPGLRLDGPVTKVELLQSFTQRAAQHALNGAGVMADGIIYRPSRNTDQSSGSRRAQVLFSRDIQIQSHEAYRQRTQIQPREIWTQPKLNQMQGCCPQKCEYGVLAAAIDGDANIHVYSARYGFVAPKYRLPSSELQIDENSETPRVCFNVILFRFGRSTVKGSYPYHTDRITALYQYEVLPGTSRPNRFVKEAMSKASSTLKLVTWDIRDENLVESRDISTSPDEEVVHMAVKNDRTVTIVFQLKNRRSRYRIRTYLCLPGLFHGKLVHILSQDQMTLRC
jgi:hypothetical protein